jgi:hypothetical protein
MPPPLPSSTPSTIPSAAHSEPTKPAPVSPPDPLEGARLEILRALEAGEIDVATAGERLAALDDAATAFDEEGVR